MNQPIDLNLSSIFLLASAILIAVFLALCVALQGVLGYIQEKARSQTQVSGDDANRSARATAASLLINFARVFLVGTATLAVGLGYWKTAAPFLQWFLPDRALGFAILISYAGLITALRAIGAEINDAVRKLFH
jgi:hypothetical protein